MKKTQPTTSRERLHLDFRQQEVRQRQDDLKSAMSLHTEICKKLSAAADIMEQAVQLSTQLERDHSRKPAHKAAFFGTRLGIRHLRAAIISIHSGLVGLAQGSERLASRNLETLTEAVGDPDLLDRGGYE